MVNDNLKFQFLSREFAWLDTGTHEVLKEATGFVKAVAKRTGLKITCLEKIALNYGLIFKKNILNNIKDLKEGYFEYLRTIISK